METPAATVSPDILRMRFSQAMSRMYRAEVPAYGALLQLTETVNAAVLAADSALRAALAAADRLEHLSEERHGAIRVGTAAELAWVARLFALLGMEPVGYYDLSVAGLPVHSTAFRPIRQDALRQNAFRVFTSLLRLDLLDDAALRASAEHVLAGRRIFSPRACALIAHAEQGGGVAADAVDAFLSEMMKTFCWHTDARAQAALYRQLNTAHSLVADVVCFQGPHINHLTPRTLDIDRVQRDMPLYGMQPKDIIEGPPRRACPILLRQTSFKAIEEPIRFPAADGAWTQGHHRARFGEVEQRGVALTPAGRALYDTLLERARALPSASADAMQALFCAFPDNWADLRDQGLAWFDYRLTDRGRAAAHTGFCSTRLTELMEHGFVDTHPIIYEDFLPVSAAGIFRSNLGTESGETFHGSPNRAVFEAALGRPILDESTLYAAQQTESIAQCLAAFAGAPAPLNHPGRPSDLPRRENS